MLIPQAPPLNSYQEETVRINPYKLFVGSMVPNWLLCRREISSSAKLLYARLCQHAGEDGKAFPGGEKLAEEIGASVPTVRRLVAELKEAGLIEVKIEKYGETARYYFLDHEWISGVRSIESETSREPEKSQIQYARSIENDSPLVLKMSGINRISKRISEENHTGAFRQVVDHWFKRYEALTGERYLFTAKDGALLKRLLKAYDQSVVTECIDALFTIRDGWIESTTGYTIGVLVNRFNKLVSVTSKRRVEREKAQKAERENADRLERMNRV